MSPKQMISARRLAVDVLNALGPREDYATTVLDRLIGQTDQKQRATDLVFGTMRNRDAIDRVIQTLSGKPTTRIPEQMLNVLRVAVYELVYNPETPVYSIVNEAVNTARKLKGGKQAGFANAVLRRITDRIIERKAALSDGPAAAIVPQTPQTGCRFDTDVLPDFESSPEDYLSTAFSLPRALVAELVEGFGPDTAREVCFGSNRRPTVYIRPNPLKTTAVELIGMLREAGVEAGRISQAPVIAVRSPHNIRRLPGFEQGFFTVQDVAASLPVTMLDPQPQWKILDLCAAPGVKTTQMAEVTGDKATIIATDIDTKRLEMLRQNILRLDVHSITAVEYQRLDESLQEFGSFDAILLDVPCSNTAVLAKRIEARHRLTPKAVKRFAETQLKLLETSATMLTPGGCICYSTCSILRVENGDLVRSFISSNSNFTIEQERLTLPSAAETDHDGGYCAILRDTSSETL